MKIDINTKMITLLGKPLGQSFAARMQNAGYEAAGLNMLSSTPRWTRTTWAMWSTACAT